jgi:hypothetical protein
MRRWNARQLDAGTGMGFVAETGSGHLLTMDGAPDGGGRNLAPRPMETVLAGTGGCTAYDVVLILKRGRHDVRGCQVKLQAERAARTPRSSRASTCTSRQRRGLPASGGGARDRAVARALLLGQHHAGQDRRDHDQPRDREVAGLTGLPAARDRVRSGGRWSSSPWPPPASASAPAPAVPGRRRPAPRRHAGVRRPSSARRWPRPQVGRRQAVQVAGQVLLDLALGLDHEAQAGASPRRPASRPMPKAPAYHSGFSRLGRSPSSSRRCSVQARWSSSSRAAWSACARAVRGAGRQRLRLVQRLGADLADVVDPHQRAGQPALGLGSGVGAGLGPGQGRAACAPPVRVRRRCRH